MNDHVSFIINMLMKRKMNLFGEHERKSKIIFLIIIN